MEYFVRSKLPARPRETADWFKYRPYIQQIIDELIAVMRSHDVEPRSIHLHPETLKDYCRALTSGFDALRAATANPKTETYAGLPFVGNSTLGQDDIEIRTSTGIELGWSQRAEEIASKK